MTTTLQPWTAAQLRHQMKSRGISQIELAKAIGSSQSQVSRVLSGRTSMSSRLAVDICIYASSGLHRADRGQVIANTELIDAMAAVWDGTPSHARALAAVIRSLTLLSSTYPTQRGSA